MNYLNLHGFKILNYFNIDFVFDFRGELYITFYEEMSSTTIFASLFEDFVSNISNIIRNVYIRSCSTRLLELKFFDIEQIEKLVFHDCNIDNIKIIGVNCVNEIYFSGTDSFYEILKEVSLKNLKVINFVKNNVQLEQIFKIFNNDMIKNFNECKIFSENRNINHGVFFKNVKNVNIFENNIFEYVSNVMITDD